MLAISLTPQPFGHDFTNPGSQAYAFSLRRCLHLLAQIRFDSKDDLFGSTKALWQWWPTLPASRCWSFHADNQYSDMHFINTPSANLLRD
jgi:hypothetical protein